MLTQAPLLLAFVPKELREGKPFDRLFIATLVGRHHAGQARGHLRTQGDIPLAFVLEIIELTDDFLAAFGSKQFERFQGRAVVLSKAVTACDRSPGIKEVLPRVA